MERKDHALETEIIGIALADQKARWELFASLQPEDFTMTGASELWSQLREMSADGLDTTYYEAVKFLPDHLEILGKAHEAYEGTVHLETKVDRLQSLSRLRRWVVETRRSSARMKQGEDPDTVLQQHLGQMMEIVAPRAGKRIYSAGQWLEMTLREAEKRYDDVQAGGMPYLDLGFPKFSRAVAVLPQNLVLLCGQTGRKKSMLALNMAAHIGMESRVPTLYLNTEMSGHECGMRVASMVSKAHSRSLRTGVDWGSGGGALRTWMDDGGGADGQLYLTDSLYDLTSTDAVTLIRQYCHQHDVEVVFLDYIQRLRDTGDGDDDWQVLVNAISRLKSAAQEMDVIIFVIAQLTDAGQLQRARYMKNEVDAMWVLEEDEDSPGTTHRLIVEKARHTEDRLSHDLYWDGHSLRFEEARY